MKKFINTLAFILIIGFAGAWECGNYDFKTLLFNTGITLTGLFIAHICIITMYIIRTHKKIKSVKIS